MLPYFSHLGVFLILVKPLTTEITVNGTTPKICKITVVHVRRIPPGTHTRNQNFIVLDNGHNSTNNCRKIAIWRSPLFTAGRQSAVGINERLDNAFAGFLVCLSYFHVSLQSLPRHVDFWSPRFAFQKLSVGRPTWVEINKRRGR